MKSSFKELLDENTKKRFYEKIDKQAINECWEWTAAVQSKGYGSFGLRPGTTILAHRLAYMLTGNRIPEGHVVMHTCDNQLCCNPEHLVTGTIVDNNRDALEKGRTANGEKNGNSKLNNSQVIAIRRKAQSEHSTAENSQKNIRYM